MGRNTSSSSYRSISSPLPCRDNGEFLNIPGISNFRIDEEAQSASGEASPQLHYPNTGQEHPSVDPASLKIDMSQYNLPELNSVYKDEHGDTLDVGNLPRPQQDTERHNHENTQPKPDMNTVQTELAPITSELRMSERMRVPTLTRTREDVSSFGGGFVYSRAPGMKQVVKNVENQANTSQNELTQQCKF